MTHTVLFCLTTHAECPSLAAGKGLATTSLMVDLQPGPLSSDEPRKSYIIIKGTVDWESENLSSGPLGVSNVPEQKSSHPKPGVKSTSLPPLKASLLQAQVA